MNEKHFYSPHLRSDLSDFKPDRFPDAPIWENSANELLDKLEKIMLPVEYNAWCCKYECDTWMNIYLAAIAKLEELKAKQDS